MSTPQDYGYNNVHDMAGRIAELELMWQKDIDDDNRKKVYTVTCLDRNKPNAPAIVEPDKSERLLPIALLKHYREKYPDFEFTIARYWVNEDGTLEHIFDLQGV